MVEGILGFGIIDFEKIRKNWIAARNDIISVTLGQAVGETITQLARRRLVEFGERR